MTEYKEVMGGLVEKAPLLKAERRCQERCHMQREGPSSAKKRFQAEEHVVGLPHRGDMLTITWNQLQGRLHGWEQDNRDGHTVREATS